MGFIYGLDNKMKGIMIKILVLLLGYVIVYIILSKSGIRREIELDNGRKIVCFKFFKGEEIKIKGGVIVNEKTTREDICFVLFYPLIRLELWIGERIYYRYIFIVNDKLIEIPSRGEIIRCRLIKVKKEGQK